MLVGFFLNVSIQRLSFTKESAMSKLTTFSAPFHLDLALSTGGGWTAFSPSSGTGRVVDGEEEELFLPLELLVGKEEELLLPLVLLKCSAI